MHSVGPIPGSFLTLWKVVIHVKQSSAFAKLNKFYYLNEIIQPIQVPHPLEQGGHYGVLISLNPI